MALLHFEEMYDAMYDARCYFMPMYPESQAYADCLKSSYRLLKSSTSFALSNTRTPVDLQQSTSAQ